MGFSFRKSVKVGPARVNISKSGVGYSIGAGGLRYTKRAGRKKKGKITLMGALCRLVGVVLAIYAVIAIAAAVYTFVLRFKWIFITLGILAIAGMITYFILKKRNNKSQETAEQEINPVP